jgi:hypothetical protein
MNRNEVFLSITTESVCNTTVSSVDTTICNDILTDLENVVKYLCCV